MIPCHNKTQKESSVSLKTGSIGDISTVIFNKATTSNAEQRKQILLTNRTTFLSWAGPAWKHLDS